MNKLDTLQKENKNLRELLEEVYEMSSIDDMITGCCLDRSDDEFLLSNLSLRSQVMEALGISLDGRKINRFSKPTNTEDILKLTKHDSSKVLSDHYSKEVKH